MVFITSLRLSSWVFYQPIKFFYLIYDCFSVKCSKPVLILWLLPTNLLGLWEFLSFDNGGDPDFPVPLST